MKHLFIGLDVHKKSWSVTIQEAKVALKRFSMEANAPTLIHYVEKHYPNYEIECCYEKLLSWLSHLSRSECSRLDRVGRESW